MNQIRILYVNGGLMDRGGVSSVMMSYYLKFDPELVHIDFVVHGDGIGERDEEILSHGSKIFKVPPKSKELVANYRGLRKIMSDGKYDIVHAHADSGNALVLKIAKECGIKVRISHSHNTDFTINNKIRILFNYIQKNQVCKYATHKWACSKAAGEWLYGKNSKFDVIPNAIDVTRFEYSSEMRVKLRTEYNLVDNTVIGHIGRFDYQKNQCFLIEAFAKATERNDEVRLVLIGDGKDRAEIEDTIKKFDVQDKVLLLGQRNNVYQLMNMFDLFAFPSRFEGLGVAVIEAQTNGLQCLCSEFVPKETNLTEQVKYLPLEITRWSEELLKPHDRNADSLKKIISSGYEINSAAKQMQNLYLEMVN